MNLLSGVLGKSDIIGASASALCAVHCIATPFLFVAQSCHADACCEVSPGWWNAIDYIFVGVTFAAVFFSARNSARTWMKYAMYGSWVVLTAFIFNEKFSFIPIAEEWKYGSAFVLISLHLYNRKFCRCGDSCPS
jgi:hypothetical protein